MADKNVDHKSQEFFEVDELDDKSLEDVAGGVISANDGCKNTGCGGSENTGGCENSSCGTFEM